MAAVSTLGVTMARRVALRLLGWFVAAAAAAAPAHAAPFIVIASTTSTEQSGLFAHLLPRFTQATGIEVRVVAVGTGHALELGRRGDADLVFVHDRDAEERFVADGHARRRHEVMANHFVIVGPGTDPAAVRGTDAAAALRRMAAAGAAFVSRGDRSGTHAAELRLWQAAGTAPRPGRDPWLRACGCGMGAALNMAAATGAYVLTDRGTWVAFRNRGPLEVLVEGDPRLFNPYGAMVVNPARHPHVKAAQAQAFVDWIVSPAGQDAIDTFRVDGQQLFTGTAR